MDWYADVDMVIRDDLVRAQQHAWTSIATPGTWWTSAQRLGIARVVIAALSDPDPLAPWVAPSSTPDRDRPDDLPGVAVDAAYRLARAPGTLTSEWYQDILGRGLTEGQYVELVTLVVRVAAIERFVRIVGSELPALPEPKPGEPTQVVPAGLHQHHHWVPTVSARDAGPELEWLYRGGSAPNVIKALTAVPDSYRQIIDLEQVGYVPFDRQMALDWHRPGLDRRQLELVAAKTSQVNGCFY